MWRSSSEHGKSQNNGLVTDTLFYSPPPVSALCSSHSLRSSHASCKMPCSPCLAHKTIVMQRPCSLMFPSLQSISLEKLLCSFKFYYSFKLQTSLTTFIFSFHQYRHQYRLAFITFAAIEVTCDNFKIDREYARICDIVTRKSFCVMTRAHMFTLFPEILWRVTTDAF